LGYGVLEMIEEAAYFYIGFVFLLGPFILMISQDKWLAILAGTIHNFVLLNKFQEKLAILIQE